LLSSNRFLVRSVLLFGLGRVWWLLCWSCRICASVLFWFGFWWIDSGCVCVAAKIAGRGCMLLCVVYVFLCGLCDSVYVVNVCGCTGLVLWMVGRFRTCVVRSVNFCARYRNPLRVMRFTAFIGLGFVVSEQEFCLDWDKLKQNVFVYFGPKHVLPARVTGCLRTWTFFGTFLNNNK